MTRQALTWGIFVLGIVFLAGGLVFLIAAMLNPARLLIALALLIPGVGLASWAGIRWRRAKQLSPDVMDQRIVSLAAAHGGEITPAQVTSALNVPSSVSLASLTRLEAANQCHQEQRTSMTIFVFPGLRTTKVVRRCAYCGNTYSVREPLHKCPNCGGELEIVKT